MPRPKHLDDLITDVQTGGTDGRPRTPAWTASRVKSLQKLYDWETNPDKKQEIKKVLDILTPFSITQGGKA